MIILDLLLSLVFFQYTAVVVVYTMMIMMCVTLYLFIHSMVMGHVDVSHVAKYAHASLDPSKKRCRLQELW